MYMHVRLKQLTLGQFLLISSRELSVTSLSYGDKTFVYHNYIKWVHRTIIVTVSRARARAEARLGLEARARARLGLRLG